MKAHIIIPFVFVLTFFFTSCNTGPKPIDYGSDGCQYCKMTIVDKIHGAEIVTNKGKVFKFDATECMLNYLQDNPDTKSGNFYTNHYESPTDLIATPEATFLISKALPSPMNGNITAFKERNPQKKYKLKKMGYFILGKS